VPALPHGLAVADATRRRDIVELRLSSREASATVNPSRLREAIATGGHVRIGESPDDIETRRND